MVTMKAAKMAVTKVVRLEVGKAEVKDAMTAAMKVVMLAAK